MKAVRKVKPESGAMIYTQIPEPDTAPGMVKVKIHACGICGSDLKFYHWSMRPGMRIGLPVTFGHEFSGVVVETGSGVTDYKPGDRVVSETANYICGKCEQCLSGNYLLCDTKRSIGYQEDGALAEYICVREELLHRIPEGVSMDEAAMSEPCCVAFHGAVDLARVMPGDWVLVMGPGTIGLLTVQIVKACGGRVILTGLSADEHRLKIGAEIGADYILNSQPADLVKDVMKITGGRFVDCAFECSGSAGALDSALEAVKKRGTIVEIALFKNGGHTLNNLNKLVEREIVLRGSYGQRNWDWDRVLHMMEQKELNLLPLITHRFSLADWEKGFTAAEKMEGIKVLLYPSQPMEMDSQK